MPRLFPLLLLFALAAPLAAQPPARTHDITPDDYFTLATVTELAVSPDGKQVAYCVATWDKDADNRKANLWVVATDGKGKPRQLTSDRANDRHPRWSADGKAVYVLANRKTADDSTKPQVWKVPLDGLPVALTNVKAGVTGFDYAAKAGAVFYSVDDTVTDVDTFTPLRKKFSTLEYGHGKRTVSELFRVAGGKPPELVIGTVRNVREFAVTPDGKRVAMITAPDDTVVTFEGRSRVDVWDADEEKVTTTDESWRKTAASPWPWLESVAISPNGNRVAVCTVFDAYPAEIVVNEWTDGAWVAKRVKRELGYHVRGYGSPLSWATNKRLGYLGENHGHVQVINQAIIEGATDFSADGSEGGAPTQFAYLPSEMPDASFPKVIVAGSPRSFPEVGRYQVGKDGWSVVPLTDLNPRTKTWKLPSVQHIYWKAPDGTEVGGVLELPFGYKKGEKKLPLVVGLHGGPTTANYATATFDIWEGRTYLPAAGYALLLPNYRGSTGYGDKFTTDLIGRENDIEVKDILAGIKHLIDEGIADPDRIAVMGWSNGGYLTNCLITLKDPPFKFKAAISGAGILDTVAEWGFNDEPAYPTVFKKGFPWEVPENYRKSSATYGLGNVKTPTLIHVGGADERCPPGHSKMLYRALREYVKVPTELIVYPGEPHGPTKYGNRKAKMEWDLAWLDKYMKGKE